MEPENNNKKKRKIAFIISIIIFIIVLLLSFVLVYRYTSLHNLIHIPFLDSRAQYSLPRDTTETTETGSSVPTGPNLPDNPIDFLEQTQINNEIYAWIYIPNTTVDYPILQSFEDDLYYLRRDVDRNYSLPGVLFTQSCNRRNFSDPVTVVYGHNMTDENIMFASLHYFENKEFFDENEFFYVYTPGHILTYRIVSAYQYDERHIMNQFNFHDEKVRREYFDYVMNPTSLVRNVREGVTLSTDDKLLILSTCMETNASRYLVNGVLIKDENTK